MDSGSALVGYQSGSKPFCLLPIVVGGTRLTCEISLVGPLPDPCHTVGPFDVVDKRLGAWGKRGAVNLLYSGQGLLLVASVSTTLCLISCVYVSVALSVFSGVLTLSAAFTLRIIVLDSFTFSAAKFNSLVLATVFRKREPSMAHSHSNFSQSVVPHARDPMKNVLVSSSAIFTGDTLTGSAGESAHWVRMTDHLLKAISEFLKAEISLIGDAAFLLTVCSKHKSPADLAYNLCMRRMDRAPAFRISWALEA